MADNIMQNNDDFMQRSRFLTYQEECDLDKELDKQWSWGSVNKPIIVASPSFAEKMPIVNGKYKQIIEVFINPKMKEGRLVFPIINEKTFEKWEETSRIYKFQGDNV